MAWIGVIAATGFVGWVGYRARADAKQRNRIGELQQRPTPDAAVEAVSMLDSTDPQVRAGATHLIVVACKSAPGKIVKQYSGDASVIVDRLGALLHDSDRNTRVNAATALSYFSRDYPEMVFDHKDTVLETLHYPNSQIQCDSSITAGNLANAYPDHAEEICTALAPLLDDEDPEVRAKVCFALGGLDLDRATELLREMTSDPNPKVQEAAAESLKTQQDQQESANNAGRSAQASAQDNSNSRFIGDSPDSDFAAVAGMDDLKGELEQKIIEPFRGNAVYEKYGINPESGILFHGPPGTGKTYLAKALAGELNVNYASVDVGDMVSKLVGEGVENITQLFDEARHNQPCLIFIDEIDALATDRSSANQSEDTKKMVNQLLQEMSEIDGSDDILVIAATNNPDDIDDAMLRTGRFDSRIHIPKPDDQARVAIFKHHLNAPLEQFDTDTFVRTTRGFVASDMVAVARRAALQAADRERETGREATVTEADILEAANEVAAEQSNIGEFIERPPEMDFSDVAGMDELKETLHTKIADPLTNPEFHEEYGLGVENGILLYGPPGTGKTHVSKCLAGELDINYIEAKAGDLVSKWIGEGAQNVQTMFNEARQNQPCLIFIDEIDALATDRNTHQTKSERQMVNQFLEELSALSDANDDVIVIGATNRPDDLDAAMLRTGRFSEKIEVPPPAADTRIALFDAHLSAPVDGIDPEAIGARTDGFVASDMANVADRSARKAMQRAKSETGSGEVTQQDVMEAVSEVDSGQ
ncbi:AAA family ATPase [Halococcus morrhuae DSM 1307]|nr:AAA family ATPase [Halococcus morrhuae]